MSAEANNKCIKCGGTYEIVGMEATNKVMPNAAVRMIRCTCSKCGFMEVRMDDKGFAQVLEKKNEV